MLWFLWTGSWQRARGKFFLVWHDFWEFRIFLPGDPYCVPEDMTTVRFQVLQGTLISWLCSKMFQKPRETQLVLSNVSSWELSDNFLFLTYSVFHHILYPQKPHTLIIVLIYLHFYYVTCQKLVWIIILERTSDKNTSEQWLHHLLSHILKACVMSTDLLLCLRIIKLRG